MCLCISISLIRSPLSSRGGHCVGVDGGLFGVIAMTDQHCQPGRSLCLFALLRKGLNCQVDNSQDPKTPNCRAASLRLSARSCLPTPLLFPPPNLQAPSSPKEWKSIPDCLRTTVLCVPDLKMSRTQLLSLRLGHYLTPEHPDPSPNWVW